MPKEKIAKKGHNRVGGIDNEQLLSIIGRIETLNEEKSGVLECIKDIYAEAQGNGFDKKAIRECVKQRAIDAQEREEFETVLDTYRMAIGLIPEVDDVV
jgi:uncharacterized protein (UPF0335 family)